MTKRRALPAGMTGRCLTTLLTDFLIRRQIRRIVRDVDRGLRARNIIQYGTETPIRGHLMYGVYTIRDALPWWFERYRPQR